MEVPNLPEVPAKMLEAVPEVPDRRIASDEEVVVVTVVALVWPLYVLQTMWLWRRKQRADRTP